MNHRLVSRQFDHSVGVWNHFRMFIGVLALTIIVCTGCDGKAATAKAEKERAKQYMDAFLKIVEERTPGANGSRSKETGLKAIEELNAIPKEGVPQDVLANAGAWTIWLKEGIETMDSGGFSKEKIKKWKDEMTDLNAEGGRLRQKYK